MGLFSFLGSLFEYPLQPDKRPAKSLPYTTDYIGDWMLDDLNTLSEEDTAMCAEAVKLLQYVHRNIPYLSPPFSCAGEKQTLGILWEQDNKAVYVEMHYHGGFYWTAKGTGLAIGEREFWDCRLPNEQFLSHLRQL